MKDLLLRARVVFRTSNNKISRRRLTDYVKKLHQTEACRTCRTTICPRSTNQSSLICGVVVVVAVPVVVSLGIFSINRELKQQRRQRQRKRHLKTNIWEMVTILLLLLLRRIPYF